jgi:hypothetical protein
VLPVKVVCAGCEGSVTGAHFVGVSTREGLRVKSKRTYSITESCVNGELVLKGLFLDGTYRLRPFEFGRFIAM